MIGKRARGAEQEVVALPPTNAWLLIGDAASYPSSADIRGQRRRWRQERLWTSPKQVEPGDLLLFYFISPHKAVHFAARAADYPFFDSRIGVNALQDVDPHQWWVVHTPMVPVSPVGVGTLRDLWGGNLVLRGQTKHYLQPRLIETLLAEGLMQSLDGDRHVLRVPSGDPALPDPDRVGLDDWRRMAAGALKLEAQVEQYVVEPLLRLALETVPDGGQVAKARRIRAGIPDYVVHRGGVATGVVEVKLAVRLPADGNWSRSPDFQQVVRYSRELGVPALLMDSSRIFLIPLDAQAPSLTLTRRELRPEDVAVIAGHLTGEAPARVGSRAGGVASAA